MRTPAHAALSRACHGLRSTSLAEVIALADLQTRIDRKYLVPAAVFTRLIAQFDTTLSALQIEGRRLFDYESVYFDTPQLLTFHQHAYGRRNRFKVRTRTYLDSDETVLEVKTEGRRGETVKERHPYEVHERNRLTPAARDVVAGCLAGPDATRTLTPSLVSRYARSTLVDFATGSRMTCDVDLDFLAGDRSRAVPGPDDLVLIESKTAGAAAPVDAALWAAGHRPISISKYCVGLALLDPQLPANRWNRTLRQNFGWLPERRYEPGRSNRQHSV